MARLVIAAAGAAIGFVVSGGNPMGAQLGWLAGSLIAGALEPPTKTEGPRLTDLAVSGSSYGTPVAWIQGHPRIAPQIIWASAKREIATTTEAGKGGGSEYTAYTYEVDLLLLLTDNEIAAVSRIWINGKLVWSNLAGSTAETLSASDNTSHWTRMTVYTGAASQLPDPTYEASVGTANAPAYRGRGTVFIQSLGLGGSGQIPNITMEVATQATLTTGGGLYVGPQAGTGSIAKVSATDGSVLLSSPLPPDSAWVNYGLVYLPGLGKVYALDDTYQVGVYDGATLVRDVAILLDPVGYPYTYRIGAPTSEAAVYASCQTQTGGYYSLFRIDTATNTVTDRIVAAATNCSIPAMLVHPDGSTVILAIEPSSGDEYLKFFHPTTFAVQGTVTLEPFNSGIREMCLSPDGLTLYVSDGLKVFTVDIATHTITNTLSDPYNVANPGFPSVAAPAGLAVSADGTVLYVGYRTTTHLSRFSTSSYALIGNVNIFATGKNRRTTRLTMTPDGARLYVTDINYGGLCAYDTATDAIDASFADVTGLTYPGGPTLATAGGTTTLLEPTIRYVVEQLCLRAGLAAGQVDASALDTITKPVHALAVSQVSSARTIIDMLARTYFFDSTLSDKLYFRPRGGASVATLTFDELGVVVDGSGPADPLALQRGNELEIPAQIAITYSNINGDYQNDTQYSDRLLTGQDSTSAMQIPIGFTASEAKAAADAILMDGAVASLSTAISLGMEYARLEATDVVTATGEDGSSYRLRLVKKTEADGVLSFDAVLDDATVFTQAGITVGGTSSQTTVAPVPVTMLELLDAPLLGDAYDAPGIYVAVQGNGTNWANAAVYDSLDDVTYTPVATINTQAAIGTASTLLADWTGGNVWDEVNSVTVSTGTQQLASLTRDAILASQAANAAMVGAEMVQYRNATLVSAGVYTLSGLLRGRRGTEWAMTGHAASERFIALGSAGMRFVPLESGDLGRLRYYKAASAGQRLSSVTADSITPAGTALECFSPVDCRADRTTADTALTWKRRTRLSTRLCSTLGINAPLGEASEAYEVEVYASGAYATLKRTISASTPAATYTSAQQVTDFGSNQGTLYLKIYQLSATVGRGYPLTTTV